MSSRLVILLVLLNSVALISCGDDPAPVDQKPEARSGLPFSLVARADTGIDFVTRSGGKEQAYIIEVKSTGVGLLDFDGDGLQDVVLVAGSTLERHKRGEAGFGVRLYKNRGGLRFEDATASAGLEDIPLGWMCAPICADIDGDGDDDLYLTAWGRNLLLVNEGGRFRHHECALEDLGWGTSAAFHDLDGDGDLDLYLCNYLDFDPELAPRDGTPGFICRWRGEPVMCGPKGFPPQQDRVFENLGGLRFRDASKDWGIDELPASFGLGVVIGDFDVDGAGEIYVANDGMANFLLDRDPATGRFVDRAGMSGLALGEDGAPQAGMGVDAADLNGDGYDDFVCTNFSSEVNDLYLSIDRDFYVEASATSGTAINALPMLAWGAFMRDIDLDGRLDLFVANGHVYPQASKPGMNTDYRQKNQLWMGRPDARFELLAERGHPALVTKEVSRGAVAGDLDLDGDQDIIVCNLNEVPTIIENRLDRAALGRRFVGVQLRTPGTNRQGIGARLRLVGVEGAPVLEMRRQYSFQSSGEARIIWGLGADVEPTGIEVLWPGGERELFPVRVNEHQLLERGEGKR